MKLTPMRFKDYIWPHNPKTFEITEKRRLAVNPVPFGKGTVTDMGVDCRVLKGEGEFVGDDAYDEFLKLRKVFDEGTAGILVHPVWQSVRVWFSSLSIKQEPMENFISYAFEFVEDDDSYSQTVNKPEEDTENEIIPGGVPNGTIIGSSGSSNSSRRTYTVKSGDTLWGISRKYGLTLNQIIALNPQIRNPNLIYTGQTVYVS
ncbi:MAG: LysM peptidoglycan-binding domain-containing protein [Ruminococcaceae bacterium]|nr:LysM peptidoglycan-binding domain-containing protein [Oscillospiraceae bacterium]